MSESTTSEGPKTDTSHEKESSKKLSKNQWRRKKAKQKKQEQHIQEQAKQTQNAQDVSSDTPISNGNNSIDFSNLDQNNKNNETPLNHDDRNISQGSKLFETEVDIALNDPQFAQYKEILDKFHTEEVGEQNTNNDDIFYSDDEGGIESDSENDGEKVGKSSLSKKKLKVMKKIPLAELKSLAPKPELVEWFDADAADPLLVVEIKSQRGVVPVPDHWQFKREYLSSKRGIKKAPFDLPSYIKDTGIMEMRDTTKDDEQTLRQKARDRVQPKMGKLDIDYAKLHNAFFKFQTKPRLYRFGELYYEGKENEMNLDHFRPGKLSQRLVEALNIPTNAPPPWLLAMQRYGPPPSYPGLKIPGLNAPIPAGSQWGFHPGGYGRPPLDENGKPLYGDVYGITQAAEKISLGNPIEKTPWGQFFRDESDDEEEEEEGEEEGREVGDGEENQEYDKEGAGYVDEETAVNREKYETDEPPELELRKGPRADLDELKESGPPKKLFQVLQEKISSKSGFMGHQKVYEIPSQSSGKNVCGPFY